MRRPRALTYVFAALVAFALVAIGVTAWFAVTGGGSSTDTAGQPLTAGGMSSTVDIRGFKYQPGNLQVRSGATVTFRNFDGAPHTATARDGSWDTDTLGKGDAKTLTFGTLGDYPYFCTIHPAMKAVLHVQ